MIKKILFKVAKALLNWASLFIYDYVDKNEDGQISKEELAILYKELKDLLKIVKK